MIDALTPGKYWRQSYSRKTKLEVLEFYHSSSYLYQVSKMFDLNTKTILHWAKDENKIRRVPGNSVCLVGKSTCLVWCTSKVHVQCMK